MASIFLWGPIYTCGRQDFLKLITTILLAYSLSTKSLLEPGWGSVDTDSVGRMMYNPCKSGCPGLISVAVIINKQLWAGKDLFSKANQHIRSQKERAASQIISWMLKNPVPLPKVQSSLDSDPGRGQNRDVSIFCQTPSEMHDFQYVSFPWSDDDQGSVIPL